MLLKNIITDKNNHYSLCYNNEVYHYNNLISLSKNNYQTIRKFLEEDWGKISIFLPNSHYYAIAYFTITLLDKIIVPIPIMAKAAEIRSTIEYCDIALILTNTAHKTLLQHHLQDVEYQVHIFNLDDSSIETIGKKKRVFEKKAPEKEPDENDVALMLHTSGTTSRPKRVMLTHKNLLTNVRSNIASLGLTQEDKTLIALPMFFGYCNTAQFLTHLYLGASIVIMDGLFLPNKFFELVEKERITNFTGVPSMLLMLLNYRNRHKYDTSSLRYICFGGGNMPVEKLRQLIELFPHTGLVQTYGQTEASPRVTALMPKDAIRKIGSVGKPIPNVQVRIVNEHGNDVQIGESGEIIVKGDNVMWGYYKRPEITKKTLKDGWLYTGDLARYDDEGYIYLVGRKKNIIIRGGMNIYPEEIEELLLSHEAIKEVCVMGEAHDMFGEVPVAKIVLHDDIGRPPTKEDLMNYCSEQLAQYKVPTKITFVTHLEKTKTGKVKRYQEEQK